MAISLVDTAVPMNDTGYPVARAKHIWFDDNATLQDKLDNKELGGDNSQTLTEAEYLALPEEQKLNNSYYLYDIGVHYKNGVAYSRKEPISLTMAEYKALGEVDPDQEYIVSADEQGILLGAEDIGYSNAVSNLPCTTVQGAIDKVNANLGELSEKYMFSWHTLFERWDIYTNTDLEWTFDLPTKEGYKHIGIVSSGISAEGGKISSLTIHTVVQNNEIKMYVRNNSDVDVKYVTYSILLLWEKNN